MNLILLELQNAGAHWTRPALFHRCHAPMPSPAARQPTPPNGQPPARSTACTPCSVAAVPLPHPSWPAPLFGLPGGTGSFTAYGPQAKLPGDAGKRNTQKWKATDQPCYSFTAMLSTCWRDRPLCHDSAPVVAHALDLPLGSSPGAPRPRPCRGIPGQCVRHGSPARRCCVKAVAPGAPLLPLRRAAPDWRACTLRGHQAASLAGDDGCRRACPSSRRQPRHVQQLGLRGVGCHACRLTTPALRGSRIGARLMHRRCTAGAALPHTAEHPGAALRTTPTHA
jgi:hypothetical protein